MSSVFDSRQGLPAPLHDSLLASVTGLLVCCAPLLVLVVRGWANAVLFLGALLAALILAGGELPVATLPRQDRRWAAAAIIAWVAPFLAVLVSAVIRQDDFLSQFDAPARSLLAVPIFLFVLRSGWPVARVMQWVLPLALLSAVAELQIVGQDPRWPSFRLTTHAVDPLVFGYLSLTFGLMCLVSISPRDCRPGRRWTVLLRLAALALGLYFSVRSMSRTGWAAVPLVIGIWAHWHWGRAHRLASFGVLLAVVMLPVLAYLLVPAVGVRIDEAIKDVVEYPWHGVLRTETSLGWRITFLRMAADVFSMHPWTGIGDFAHLPPPPPEAFAYAAPEAIRGGFTSGFHNQIASNAVRSGIGGLVATSALLFVPLLVCARGLRRGPAAARRDAMMGVAYCTCVVVSSLSTEVVDLKFAASFYAVMTAVFCGAVLGRRGPREDPA